MLSAQVDNRWGGTLDYTQAAGQGGGKEAEGGSRIRVWPWPSCGHKGGGRPQQSPTQDLTAALNAEPRRPRSV